MPRKDIIHYPNAIYHVMSRGVNKQNIFNEKIDFIYFLSLLKKAHQKFAMHCLVFCLMPNHYHLLIQTSLANLPEIMKFINQNYALYFLSKNPDKDGHVFRDRYKKKLVECELYIKELFRYIHLNPVKSKLTADPTLWEWSSYQTYILNKPNYSFMNTHLISDIFSQNLSKQKHMMIDFVNQKLHNKNYILNLWQKQIISKPITNDSYFG
jgi:putative transposase